MDQINNSKKSKDPSDLISYKQARARTRCLLRSSKKQSWEEFVSSINAPVSTSTMWRQIRKLSGQPNNFTFQPLSDQNKLFQTPSEISELLATNYSRISADSNFDSDFLPIKRTLRIKQLISPRTIPHPALLITTFPSRKAK